MLGILDSIDVLMLEKTIKQKLKEGQITNLKQLSNMKKRQLTKLGFTAYEIEQIEIKLQLEGLDLQR